MSQNPEQTPTPRTDEAAFYFHSEDSAGNARSELVTTADFAKVLETELAAQTAEVERLKAELGRTEAHLLNAGEVGRSLRASIAAKDEALRQAKELNEAMTEEIPLLGPGHVAWFSEVQSAINTALSPSAGSELLERVKTLEAERDRLRTQFDRRGDMLAKMTTDKNVMEKEYLDIICEIRRERDRMGKALEEILIRVAEMQKDARTDYSLPSLAKIDFDAIVAKGLIGQTALAEWREGK